MTENKSGATYLTVEQACDYLGIKRAYLYRIAAELNVPRYRAPVNGRRVLFRKSDLDRLKKPRLAR